jgi:ADP-heptose:LPS heptosyltransferase
VLYRTASLPHLRHALPGARIAYVCAPLTAEILETDPSVDEVLPLVTADRVWRGSRAARTALRERAFDAALCTDHIDYGGDLRLAAEIGIPNRAGFAHKGLSGLSTVPIYPGGPQPAPAFFRDMVAALTVAHATWDLTPRMTLTLDDRRRAEAVWRELAIPPGRTVVACSITWRQPNPLWPPTSFMRALDMLDATTDLEVLLCGSAADAPALEAAARASRARCHVLPGRLTLRPLAALIGRCSAFLGPDSGLRHIANAVGTPVVFIRNLAAARVETGVYCDNETDVAPLGDYLSRDRQAAALAEIDPAHVARVIARVMRPRTTATPGVA